MNARSRQGLALAVSAGLVVVGVGLGGSEQNPWSLFIAWLVPVCIIDAMRESRGWFSFSVAAVAMTAAVYGVVQTLGPEHSTSTEAILVYFGLVGGVMAATRAGPLAAAASSLESTANSTLQRPGAGAPSAERGNR